MRRRDKRVMFECTEWDRRPLQRTCRPPWHCVRGFSGSSALLLGGFPGFVTKRGTDREQRGIGRGKGSAREDVTNVESCYDAYIRDSNANCKSRGIFMLKPKSIISILTWFTPRSNYCLLQLSSFSLIILCIYYHRYRLIDKMEKSKCIDKYFKTKQ